MREYGLDRAIGRGEAVRLDRKLGEHGADWSHRIERIERIERFARPYRLVVRHRDLRVEREYGLVRRYRDDVELGHDREFGFDRPFRVDVDHGESDRELGGDRGLRFDVGLQRFELGRLVGSGVCDVCRTFREYGADSGGAYPFDMG